MVQTHAEWELPSYLSALLSSEYFLHFKVQLGQIESFGKAMLNCSFYNRQSLGLFMYRIWRPWVHSRTVYSEKLWICRNTLSQREATWKNHLVLTRDAQICFRDTKQDLWGKFSFQIWDGAVTAKAEVIQEWKGPETLELTGCTLCRRDDAVLSSHLFPLSFIHRIIEQVPTS